MWECGYRKLPVSMTMLPAESPPKWQSVAVIFLLSSKSQASTYVLVQSLLQSNPCLRISLCTMARLSAQPPFPTQSGLLVSDFGRVFHKALCVVDIKLRMDSQLCSIRSLFISVINYITEGKAGVLFQGVPQGNSYLSEKNAIKRDESELGECSKLFWFQTSWKVLQGDMRFYECSPCLRGVPSLVRVVSLLY